MARAGRPGDPRSLVLRADAAFGAGRAVDAGRFAAAAITRAEQVLDEHAAGTPRSRSGGGRALRGARGGEPAGLGHRPRRHRGPRPPGRPGRRRARPGALARHGAVPARDDELRCAPTTPHRSCRPGSWPSTPACSGRSRPSTTCAPTTPGGSTARPRRCRPARASAELTRALRLPQRAFSARSMLEMLEAAAHLVDGTATPSETRRRADGIASHGGRRPPARAGGARGRRPHGARPAPRGRRAGDRVARRRCSSPRPSRRCPTWAPRRWSTPRSAGRTSGRSAATPAAQVPANRGAFAWADAVAAGRAGRRDEAAALLAEGDAALAGVPWWRGVLRTVVLECAVTDGWGDPGADPARRPGRPRAGRPRPARAHLP